MMAGPRLRCASAAFGRRAQLDRMHVAIRALVHAGTTAPLAPAVRSMTRSPGAPGANDLGRSTLSTRQSLFCINWFTILVVLHFL